LLLQFFNVSLGIVSLKDQIMNLFLEKLNDCIALSDDSITLIDLIFSMKDGLISCCDDLILLSHQGLKFHYLNDLTVSILIVTLSHTSQLTHATKQQNLIMVLNIHEPGETTNHFFSQISQQVTNMVYLKVPFWMTGVYSREQTNGIPSNLHWMLVAENIYSLQSSSLDGIDKTIPYHINFYGMPLGAERMLRNRHPNSASRNTFFSILHSIVLGRLSVMEQT
jgi:hypothetical protein